MMNAIFLQKWSQGKKLSVIVSLKLNNLSSNFVFNFYLELDKRFNYISIFIYVKNLVVPISIVNK